MSVSYDENSMQLEYFRTKLIKKLREGAGLTCILSKTFFRYAKIQDFCFLGRWRVVNTAKSLALLRGIAKISILCKIKI